MNPRYSRLKWSLGFTFPLLLLTNSKNFWSEHLQFPNIFSNLFHVTNVRNIFYLFFLTLWSLFYGWGFNCFKATEPLRVSLLFTTFIQSHFEIIKSTQRVVKKKKKKFFWIKIQRQLFQKLPLCSILNISVPNVLNMRKLLDIHDKHLISYF